MGQKGNMGCFGNYGGRSKGIRRKEEKREKGWGEPCAVAGRLRKLPGSKKKKGRFGDTVCYLLLVPSTVGDSQIAFCSGSFCLFVWC